MQPLPIYIRVVNICDDIDYESVSQYFTLSYDYRIRIINSGQGPSFNILEISHQINMSCHHRAVNSDFRMGGDWSPPIGGGLKGGDKGPMGGEWRVIRDIFWH